MNDTGRPNEASFHRLTRGPFICLALLLAVGCSTDREPIVVSGSVINQTAAPDAKLALTASAVRRESKIIMGAPVYSDEASQSPRFVSIQQQPDGTFVAQAKDAKGLTLAAPGYRLLRKDQKPSSPKRTLTFTRSTSGVQLEIKSDD